MLAVADRCIRMGRVFWFSGKFVSENLSRFGDVVWHGEINGAIGVVPLEMGSKEYYSLPVGCTYVLFGEVIDEVLSVCPVGLFDAKVIDDEAEIDGASSVAKKARCLTSGDVPSGG